MPEHALKEWAVTIEALAQGRQVLIVRKGGIHEKRFELPHPRFFLFPTFLHQRPELVKPEHREQLAAWLDAREEPVRLPLPAYAQLHDAHPIRDPEALAAIDPLHILAPEYAAERLRWRRTQPLWAVVLRVWRLPEPVVLEGADAYGGCKSWVDLPEGLEPPGRMEPALSDEEFEAAAEAVSDALAVVAGRRG